MVAEEQDSPLRTDPVESFAIRIAVLIEKLNPVPALELADHPENLAVVRTPDRTGADQNYFFHLDTVIHAARDQQVAIFSRVEGWWALCNGLRFGRCFRGSGRFALERRRMVLHQSVKKSTALRRVSVDAVQPFVELRQHARQQADQLESIVWRFLGLHAPC